MKSNGPAASVVATTTSVMAQAVSFAEFYRNQYLVRVSDNHRSLWLPWLPRQAVEVESTICRWIFQGMDFHPVKGWEIKVYEGSRGRDKGHHRSNWAWACQGNSHGPSSTRYRVRGNLQEAE